MAAKIHPQAKACPICATVSMDIYCPTCRKAHIVVRMLTRDELRKRWRKNSAGNALIEKAAKALEIYESEMVSRVGNIEYQELEDER